MRCSQGRSDTHQRLPRGSCAVGLASRGIRETYDQRWVEAARRIAGLDDRVVWDEDKGFFSTTAKDCGAATNRPREATDNAIPSGTSLAVELLLHLAELQHDADFRRRASFTLETLAEPAAKFPSAFGHLLGSMDMELNRAVQIALIGNTNDSDFQALERVVAEQYVPSLVLAGREPVPMIGSGAARSRSLRDGKSTAYVCRGIRAMRSE